MKQLFYKYECFFQIFLWIDFSISILGIHEQYTETMIQSLGRYTYAYTSCELFKKINNR